MPTQDQFEYSVPLWKTKTFPTEDALLRYRVAHGLIFAVLFAVLVILLHGIGQPYSARAFFSAGTAAGAALGGAVGLGGVLGFLFGIPARDRSQPMINKVETLAIRTGAGPQTVNDHLPPAAEKPAENKPSEDKAHTDAEQTAASAAAALQAQAVPAPKNVSAESGKAPATQSDASKDNTAKGATAYNPNASNLEQVADWVTKLLLGGGLTQMGRIPPKIWMWAHLVAQGMLPGESDERLLMSYQAFAAGVMVYGFIVGFFGGFLITKLQLGKAISNDPVN